MRIAYLHRMKDDPDRIRMVALEHAAYRRDLRPPAYLGGPFADRLGGPFTFDADSPEVAESVIGSDPSSGRGTPTRSAKPSYDGGTATQLWQVSAELVGLTTVG